MRKADGIRRLASGKFGLWVNGVLVYKGASAADCKAWARDEVAASYEEQEAPTCSLCDGVGHGYPGAGPCWLEERGAWDDDAEERWVLGMESRQEADMMRAERDYERYIGQ